jgi:hypothetical protein
MPDYGLAQAHLAFQAAVRVQEIASGFKHVFDAGEAS